MTEQFPIIEIPPDAPEADEDLGTKEKFWFRYQNLPYLYKKPDETQAKIGRRR